MHVLAGPAEYCNYINQFDLFSYSVSAFKACFKMYASGSMGHLPHIFFSLPLISLPPK